uniref:Uncharacterized protein n=1 Tax=Hyaloperonospora arabidopsidis (strain Emoy2) TaxID=559515 RepID=M4B9P5_HYAAE
MRARLYFVHVQVGLPELNAILYDDESWRTLHERRRLIHWRIWALTFMPMVFKIRTTGPTLTHRCISAFLHTPDLDRLPIPDHHQTKRLATANQASFFTWLSSYDPTFKVPFHHPGNGTWSDFQDWMLGHMPALRRVLRFFPFPVLAV